MKKDELPNLSPYKMWWVIVSPYNGIVRKCDIMRLERFSRGGFNFHQERFCSFFPSKEEALAFITANLRLSKLYEARLVTDKQFGDIRVKYLPSGASLWDIPYTSKQDAEVFVMQ